MDRQTAEWLLSNVTNPLVKVEPRARGGHCTWGRARLLSVVNDDYAIIQPFGHRREEKIELEYLNKWASANGGVPVLDEKPLTTPLAEKLAEKIKEKEPMKKGWPELKYTEEQKRQAVELRRTTRMTYKEIGAKIKMLPASVDYYVMKERDRLEQLAAKTIQAPPTAPTTQEVRKVITEVPTDTKLRTTLEAIRAILKTELGDHSKLLAIEGLVS